MTNYEKQILLSYYKATQLFVMQGKALSATTNDLSAMTNGLSATIIDPSAMTLDLSATTIDPSAMIVDPSAKTR